MNKYDIIFEAIQDRVNSGILTVENASIINNIAYDKYICEMKTTSEYREEKFRKKHDYDKKTKTISMNGNRIKYKFTCGSNKKNKVPNSAFIGTGYKKNDYSDEYIRKIDSIEMDQSSFNQKHPKTHEVIANHEYGHIMDVKKKRELKNEKPLFTSVTKLPPDIISKIKELNKESKLDNPNEERMNNLYNEIDSLCTKHNLKDNKNEYFKLKLYLKRLIKKSGGVNTLHGMKMDEYLSDYYAKNKTSQKDFNHAMDDIKRSVRKSKDLPDKQVKEEKQNGMKELDVRKKISKELSKDNRADYLK